MPRVAPREKMIQVGFLCGALKHAKWVFCKWSEVVSGNSWTGLLGSRPSQWRTGRLGFDPLGLLGWRKSQHYVFLAAQGLGSGLVAAGLVWLVASWRRW